MSIDTNMTGTIVQDKTTAKKQGLFNRYGHYFLLAPGVIWMILFLVVPLIMMLYVSFWTQTTFAIKPDLTVKSWVTFFSSDTYFGALLRTLRIWLTVLVLTFAIGYPAALFIGQYVRNKTVQTILLVACVIPFWTSFLIRVLAWRPMLGKEGAINIVLMKIGIITQPIDVLLFTELSVIIGMVQIYVVFMVGPIAFMLARIDESLIEAARDLGASSLADIPQDHLSLEPARRGRRRDFRIRHGAWRICHRVRPVRAEGQPARKYHRDPGRIAQMGICRRHRGRAHARDGSGDHRPPSGGQSETRAVSGARN